MDEGDIFGIITLDRERARSITIAKTIVVMRKIPLKPKGIHISGDTTKVSTLHASTRILESKKKDKEGVVSAITPWNFPLIVITRKVGSALACSCTVIVKPSELTPLTALAAVELALQAGIPPGVLNVVMGNASDIGDALLASPQVRKIIYTGSTTVGKRLMKGATGIVRIIPLELGGNSPCIVFDDADLDVAVKGVLAAKFRNSGQTCVCANRVIVQEGIYERFVVAFSKAFKNLQVGDGFIEAVVQCRLINEAVVQKVESFLQDALSKGAKVILGGKRHSLGMTFYKPTIVTDVKTGMLLAREEVFGPMAPLLWFKTEEENICIANDTDVGLDAYIFTNNGVSQKLSNMGSLVSLILKNVHSKEYMLHQLREVTQNGDNYPLLQYEVSVRRSHVSKGFDRIPVEMRERNGTQGALGLGLEAKEGSRAGESGEEQNGSAMIM
ncbi:hypothetical protein V6N13_126023 [Hibiscus sabdariffa]